MPLRLLTLGSPTELLGEDGTPLKFSNAKHLSLLAYLTLEPGDYSREELTRFIWSSADPGSMNDALSTLRGVFGKEVFPHRAQRIQFDSHLVECDAAELLAARSDPARMPGALALYRGPFLEDFNERGAGYRLTRWVAAKRKELEGVFLTLCDQACGEAAAREAWDEVVDAAKQGLRHVPGWEAGTRWLALAEEAQAALQAPPAAVAAPRVGASAVPPEPALAPVASASPVGLEPKRRSSRFVGLAALLLIAAVGMWAWRGIMRSQDEPGDSLANAPRGAGSALSATAPVCQPGEASALLVDEVFFYGTRVRPGRPFRKAWMLQNVGGCTWGTDFRLHYVGSSDGRLSKTMTDIPLEAPLPPGQIDTFEVPMQAPGTPGEYGETWQLRDGGDRPVRIGDKLVLRAGVRVPLPHYPPCGPGEGSGLLLLRKFPPGAAVPLGEPFRYSWTVKNAGECAWGAGSALRFRSHSDGRLSREDVVVPTRTVEPDETYTFLVPMRAPRTAGIYQETWELRGPGGTPVIINGSPTLGMQIHASAPDDRPKVAPICGPGEAQIRFYDENWLDSTRVRPGQIFTKRWTVLNSGTCTWGEDFRLRYSHNEGGQLALSRADKPLGENLPPETAHTFEVPMRVPEHRGYIRENWRLLGNGGIPIRIGTSSYLAAILMVEPVSTTAQGSGGRRAKER